MKMDRSEGMRLEQVEPNQEQIQNLIRQIEEKDRIIDLYERTEQSLNEEEHIAWKQAKTERQNLRLQLAKLQNPEVTLDNIK